jgi:PAS domain S-box-containing protein
VIWDWNIVTDSVEWNENVKAVLGYNSTKTSKAWWLERIHPEDKERVESKLNIVLSQTGLHWSDEYRFRCSDDSYKHFFDRGFLMTDQHGSVVRMIGSMQDITQQKEEQHHLKLLESVITNATDVVMITEARPIDEPGPKIVYVNYAFTQVTGYSREDVIGRSPRFLQGPLSSREKLNKVREAIKNGEPFETEIVNYRKDGTSFWLNMAIAPVTDSAGNLTHFISVQRDITDRMNYVKAIEEQNTRLKEISWTQSHIVRAPLARIMGLIEILPKYDTDARIPKEILGYILNSANELDQIIREIVMKTEGIYNTSKNDT